MSETSDWDLDDEDTTDDSPELPPDSRDTPLDLTVEAIRAMRDGVVKIEELSEFPREEEIILRICANANLGRTNLNISRKFETDEGLSFLECHFTGIGNAYIYMTKAHQNPSFARFEDNELVDIEHPGATVLLRINGNCKAIEVYRWKEKE